MLWVPTALTSSLVMIGTFPWRHRPHGRCTHHSVSQVWLRTGQTGDWATNKPQKTGLLTSWFAPVRPMVQQMLPLFGNTYFAYAVWSPLHRFSWYFWSELLSISLCSYSEIKFSRYGTETRPLWFSGYGTATSPVARRRLKKNTPHAL